MALVKSFIKKGFCAAQTEKQEINHLGFLIYELRACLMNLSIRTTQN